MLLKIAVVVLTGLWCLPVYAKPNHSINVRHLLSQASKSWAKGTVISFPDSSSFNDSTGRWSTFDAPNYVAAVSPANEAEVARLVCDWNTPKTRKEQLLMSCHRSNLHHPMASPFSPPVGAMDTPLPWEIFTAAWQLTLAGSNHTALTALPGL